MLGNGSENKILREVIRMSKDMRDRDHRATRVLRSIREAEGGASYGRSRLELDGAFDAGDSLPSDPNLTVLVA